MAVLKSDDKCVICKHMKIWTSNYTRARCDLDKKKDGFSPEEIIPRKCVGENYRR